MAIKSPLTLSACLKGFREYLLADRRFSAATVQSYCANIEWIIRHFGDVSLTDVTLQTVLRLKSQLFQRGAKESRVAVVLYTLRAVLQYARDILDYNTLDPQLIRTPRPPSREVVYLNDSELESFLNAIPLHYMWNPEPRFSGVCFRALVETLIATAMRISESLSLNRDGIDFDKREAVIIGKGNKQRVVFFTPRAIAWIRKYLELRRDNNPALFATQHGRRLTVNGVQQTFQRTVKRAKLAKRVTPHTLRHTAATLLLRNGCPIGYIKEVLGHSRLETTCRYYLGVLDKADTKRAFDQYMLIGDDSSLTSAITQIRPMIIT